jgi:cell division protein FtsB
MMHSPRKRRRIFVLYRVGLIALLALVAFVAVRGAWNMYGKMVRSKAEAAESQARYADLQAREAFVTGAIERLQTPYGVEAALREKYGVAREGESVIVIVDEEDQAKASSTATTSLGFWAGVKSFFLD